MLLNPTPFTTYISLLTFFTDTCTTVIIPLVKTICEEIPKQCTEPFLMVARLFGKLSYGLAGKYHRTATVGQNTCLSAFSLVPLNFIFMWVTVFAVNLNESQKKWFLDFYRKMSHSGDPNKNSRVGTVTLALQVCVIVYFSCR